MIRFIRHGLVALIAAAMTLSSVVATAGQTCEAQTLTANALGRAMTLAQQTEESLNATKARVVLIARMGQNLSQYRVKFSHLGFAYKTDSGPWRVVHKLNTCNSDQGHVYEQGLGEFFMDDLYRYEAGIIAFAPEFQDRLLTMLKDPVRATAVHEPSYSMLSYPWSTRYQQSNQWALESLASALEPTAQTRAQAQAWLQFKDYKAADLRIGTITRLGARISRANVAFDDHPNDQRYAGRISTATADSVLTFVRHAGLTTGHGWSVTEFGRRESGVP